MRIQYDSENMIAKSGEGINDDGGMIAFVIAHSQFNLSSTQNTPEMAPGWNAYLRKCSDGSIQKCHCEAAVWVPTIQDPTQWQCGCFYTSDAVVCQCFPIRQQVCLTDPLFSFFSHRSPAT